MSRDQKPPPKRPAPPAGQAGPGEICPRCGARGLPFSCKLICPRCRIVIVNCSDS